MCAISSEYPAHRSKKDSDGVDVGVAGSVNLLQNATLSTQPIASLDWSPDKQGLCVCSGFDQSVRVLIVTKLNAVWKSRRMRKFCAARPNWREVTALSWGRRQQFPTAGNSSCLSRFCTDL